MTEGLKFLKTSLKTFPIFPMEQLQHQTVYAMECYQWRRDFEASLREVLDDYNDFKSKGIEVQRWDYAIFVIKEILGDG